MLWFGTMAQRGTPQPVLDALNGAINKALKDPDIVKTLERDGMIASGGPASNFGQRIRSDYERWSKLVKEANIKIE